MSHRPIHPTDSSLLHLLQPVCRSFNQSWRHSFSTNPFLILPVQKLILPFSHFQLFQAPFYKVTQPSHCLTLGFSWAPVTAPLASLDFFQLSLGVLVFFWRFSFLFGVLAFCLRCKNLETSITIVDCLDSLVLVARSVYAVGLCCSWLIAKMRLSWVQIQGLPLAAIQSVHF